MAQSGGVTRGEDQSTGQLGLRLRRVLILFGDNRARISRPCPIAEDPAGVAVLLELVRTRAPNRQRIRIRRLHGISSAETTDQSTPEELPKETSTSGTPSRLNERRRFSTGNATGPSKINGVEDPSETPLGTGESARPATTFERGSQKAVSKLRNSKLRSHLRNN